MQIAEGVLNRAWLTAEQGSVDCRSWGSLFAQKAWQLAVTASSRKRGTSSACTTWR